jgi:hypothetical protein
MKYYGIIGQSTCTVDETETTAAPNGYIEMQGARPAPDYVAQPDGTWARPESTAEPRLSEIAARLTEIDLASVRPLRAIAQGTVTDFDRAKLAALEAEAEELRAERAALMSA